MAQPVAAAVALGSMVALVPDGGDVAGDLGSAAGAAVAARAEPEAAAVTASAKGAGLTEAEALALMDKYFQNGKPTGVTAANGINGPSRDWFSIVNDAISQAVIEKARQNVAGGAAQNSGLPVVQGGGGAGGSGSASATGGNGGGLSANSGGATYVSNITIPGLADREVIRFADPISQARNEDLLRKLAQAKSTAIR